ncbi:Transducin (beta)-like 1 X-linked receptor 1 [Gonapodya sp. JEL0774]|nr:Transducin (beta)-like 1 X-linked receptor 1 [Gonapodya sp. JEL0774]
MSSILQASNGIRPHTHQDHIHLNDYHHNIYQQQQSHQYLHATPPFADELNFIVYRYLLESGFSHSAFALKHEADVFSRPLADFSDARPQPGLLILAVRKASDLIRLENHVDPQGRLIDCDAPWSLVWAHEHKHSVGKSTSKVEPPRHQQPSSKVPPPGTLSAAADDTAASVQGGNQPNSAVGSQGQSHTPNVTVGGGGRKTSKRDRKGDRKDKDKEKEKEKEKEREREKMDKATGDVTGKEKERGEKERERERERVETQQERDKEKEEDAPSQAAGSRTTIGAVVGGGGGVGADLHPTSAPLDGPTGRDRSATQTHAQAQTIARDTTARTLQHDAKRAKKEHLSPLSTSNLVANPQTSHIAAEGPIGLGTLDDVPGYVKESPAGEGDEEMGERGEVVVGEEKGDVAMAEAEESASAHSPSAPVLQTVTDHATEADSPGVKHSRSLSPSLRLLEPGSYTASSLPNLLGPLVEGEEVNWEWSRDKIEVMLGHRSEIFAAAWRVGSEVIASGAGDATARIWQVPPIPGAEVSPPVVLEHRSTGAEGKDVTTLEWNPDGSLLATGAYDGKVRVWSPTGTLVREWKRHNGPVFSIRWNKHGTLLLSGSVDKVAVVWDVGGEGPRQTFRFHAQPILDVDWKDDITFATCGSDRTVYICQLGTLQPYRKMTGHSQEVNCLRWSPDGLRIATCSDDMTVRVWNPSEPSQYALRILQGHTKEVYTVRWNPDTSGGRMLASGSFDSTVRIWSADQGTCLHILTRHTGPVYSVSFSPDGSYLSAGSFDTRVSVWKVKENFSIFKSVRGANGIFEVNWSPDGRKIAVCYADWKVAILYMD